MFILKQFIKALILPPTLWLVLLLIVLIFWHRRWARKLLCFTLLLVFALHSNAINYALRYPLESYYRPLLNIQIVGGFDAIVVLTGETQPADGNVPFPSVHESMFRRLEEAQRLYVLRPKPIIVSGGHVNPFTEDKGGNRIARDYLIRWGVRQEHVIGEDKSRDTFESAFNTAAILRRRGWNRYLLVTSAVHMPRSMMVFGAQAPQPIAAPGDFSLNKFDFTYAGLFPSESAGSSIRGAIHEYLGLINYYWRLHYAE